MIGGLFVSSHKKLKAGRSDKSKAESKTTGFPGSSAYGFSPTSACLLTASPRFSNLLPSSPPMKKPKSSNTDAPLNQGEVLEIAAEATLQVRSRALKWGLAPAKCLTPEDHWPGVMHLGVEMDGEIVAVATFFAEDLPGQTGKGARLRQMGVLPSHRGLGLGEKLISAGIEKLHHQRFDYLWCNARRLAYGFYEAQGMTFISGEFEVSGVGPHRQMLLALPKPSVRVH